MINKINFKDLIVLIVVIILFVLGFFIIKPVLYSIIYGILLAYIFYPLYNYIYTKIKNKRLSALVICLGLLVITLVLASFFIGALFKQAINFYLFLREIDLGRIVNDLLPSFMTSNNFPVNIASSLNTLVSNIISNSFKKIGDLVMDLPRILLNLFVVFFVFYYGLKNGKDMIEYIKSLSLFKKETEEKFFKQLKDVTTSVLIGHIVVGIIQGMVAGIGYYIFGVPNFILLTFLSIIMSVIPLLGPWTVWVPADIYLFSQGNSIAGFGLLIYGTFFVSLIDNFLRLIIISKRTKINYGVLLVGMIGGIYTFGILGLIIGPLVLAYVLLIIEVYKQNKIGENLVFKKVE